MIYRFICSIFVKNIIMEKEKFSELVLAIRKFIADYTQEEVSPIMYDCRIDTNPNNHPRFYIVNKETERKIITISLDLV